METVLLIILPIITAGIAIASFFIARTAEARKRGTVDGGLKSDIDYIKIKVTEISREQERINTTLSGHLERIVRVEESMKAAHKRLDEMSKKRV